MVNDNILNQRKIEYENLKKQIRENKEQKFKDQKNLEYKIRLVESNIPMTVLEERTFEKFKTSEVKNGNKIIQQVKDFIDLNSKIIFLVLYGNNGRGKTHLATAIGLEVLKDLDVIYWPITELADELRHGQSNNTYYDCMNRLKNCHLLILDDYPDYKDSTFMTEKLDLLINHRYDYKNKTIITTNLTLLELTNFNKRIASRLMSGICIELVGKDYRIESAKSRKIE